MLFFQMDIGYEVFCYFSRLIGIILIGIILRAVVNIGKGFCIFDLFRFRVYFEETFFTFADHNKECIDGERFLWYHGEKLNKKQLRDRGAVVISRAGARHRKAVASLKGAAAEDGEGELCLGERITSV